MPIDPTPPGAGIMTPTPEDKKLPQPEEAGNGRPSDVPNPRDDPRDNPRDAATDLRRRPELPAATEVMAADVEDEEADPVIDTGPGVADGPNTRAPGR